VNPSTASLSLRSPLALSLSFSRSQVWRFNLDTPSGSEAFVGNRTTVRVVNQGASNKMNDYKGKTPKKWHPGEREVCTMNTHDLARFNTRLAGFNTRWLQGQDPEEVAPGRARGMHDEHTRPG
jgi:hypothetical protein